MSARLPTRSASLQRGSALIETILALSLILALVGISLPFLLDQRADEEAQAYGRHIRGLIERIHQYQYYKITELGIEPSSKNELATKLISFDDRLSQSILEFVLHCAGAKRRLCSA